MGAVVSTASVRSVTCNLTVELVRRGYSEEDIGKFWGLNLLRVLDQVQAKTGCIGYRIVECHSINTHFSCFIGPMFFTESLLTDYDSGHFIDQRFAVCMNWGKEC
ncbi:MAG: hypothetical protein CM1200mP24_02110 [Gammaproteobacteria bacterium]|nr:MAG: hypothetical protein CM1200mP24_02110 [Gammaproteobacteria bacterium]